MSNLEFFKNEAKKFLKDWRTQIKTVESDGFISYHYDWKFYDVGDLFFYYELDDEDEQDIKLARAQHWISKMVGFKKWDELIHASDIELELAEFLLRRFKNAQDVQDWEETVLFAGLADLEPETKLDYARQYYELGDKAAIVNHPTEQITILSGKLKNIIKDTKEEANKRSIEMYAEAVKKALVRYQLKENEQTTSFEDIASLTFWIDASIVDLSAASSLSPISFKSS